MNMSAIRPILFATLPTYVVMSLMITAMATAYEVVENIMVNHPEYSLSALSLLFLAMFVAGTIPSKVISRLTEFHKLDDVRIQLPDHWRTVVLDIVAWVRTHVYSQMLLFLGFVGVFWAISGSIIYSLRAIQASTPEYLLVILAGTFIGLFAFSAGRVVYRSALVPVDAVSDAGLDSIIRALPVMNPKRIELLRRWKSDEIPQRTMKLTSRLYMLGIAGLGVSGVASPIGLPFLTNLGILFAGATMMLATVVVFASYIFDRRSRLSMVLNPKKKNETE